MSPIPGDVLNQQQDPAYAPQTQPYAVGQGIAQPNQAATANSAAGFNAADQAALNSANPFQQIVGQLGAGAANQVAAGNLGIASAEANYGLTNAQQAVSNEYNNTLAGYQLGQLGISQQQLGIQGTSLQQQQQLQGVQTGVEQATYGLQQQVYPEEQAEATANYNEQQSQLQGGLAASGALNTKGSTQQQTLLGQNYAWQQADIGRAQQEAQLGQQATVAGQQYSEEQINNAQSNLSLLAQANGMSEQEVYNQLAYMTANNQIQGAENPIALLNTIAQINQGDLTGTENLISPAGFANGGLNYFPGMPAGG
jgi:hypothetical protein